MTIDPPILDPPAPAQDGLRWEIVIPVPDAGDAASPYARSRIQIVEPEQVIVQLVNAAGEPVVAAAPEEIPPLELGQNVAWAQAGRSVKATAKGAVRLKNGKVRVETALEINGNVDFAVGNIDFDGDVIVHGNIVDLFKVSSTGTVSVDKAIEAADVSAVSDIVVGGGITGRDKGKCSAGHNIIARYLANAHVQAVNDVIAASEVANSRVICGGQLRIDHGPLIAGHTTANGGVCVRSMGSPTGVKTIVEAGIDEQLRSMCATAVAEIEAELKKCKQVRDTVEPLLRNQKTLTAQQKEKATELLYNASELEAESKRKLGELRMAQDLAQSKAKAEVCVTDVLNCGVTIRFPGMETTIQSPLRGPLRIARKRVNNVWQIVLISNSGATLPLEFRAYGDPLLENVTRLLAAHP